MNKLRTLLTAGLVALCAGCGNREKISAVIDLNGDGKKDVIMNVERKVSSIEITQENGMSERFKAVNCGGIGFFKNEKGDAYFFNGTNFQFAPAWKELIYAPNIDKIKYTPATK